MRKRTKSALQALAEDEDEEEKKRIPLRRERPEPVPPKPKKSKQDVLQHSPPRSHSPGSDVECVSVFGRLVLAEIVLNRARRSKKARILLTSHEACVDRSYAKGMARLLKRRVESMKKELATLDQSGIGSKTWKEIVDEFRHEIFFWKEIDPNWRPANWILPEVHEHDYEDLIKRFPPEYNIPGKSAKDNVEEYLRVTRQRLKPALRGPLMVPLDLLIPKSARVVLPVIAPVVDLPPAIVVPVVVPPIVPIAPTLPIVAPIPVVPRLVLDAEEEEGKHEDSAATMSGAAVMVGSRVVVNKKSKKMSLRHNLNPSDGLAWSQICMREAAVWTARLQAGLADGTIKKEDYDGHVITREEWNAGGYNPYAKKRIGPDRRSQYQYFSRNQRLKVQAIIDDYIMKPKTKREQDRRVKKAQKLLARKEKRERRQEGREERVAGLEAELAGPPADDEKKHEVDPGSETEVYASTDVDLRISETDMLSGDDLAVVPRSALNLERFGIHEEAKKTETPEYVCFRCQGPRDEFSQVCPTCMRSGELDEQVEADEQLDTTDDEFPGGVMLATRRGMTAIDEGKERGNIFFLDDDVFESLTPRHSPRSEIGPRRKYAQTLLAAMIAVGSFIYRHCLVGEAGVILRVFNADFWDLLALAKNPLRDWNLQMSTATLAEYGMTKDDFKGWETEDSTIPIPHDVRAFILGEQHQWKGNELRPKIDEADFFHLYEWACRFERCRQLFYVLIKCVITQKYYKEENAVREPAKLFLMGPEQSAADLWHEMAIRFDLLDDINEILKQVRSEVKDNVDFFIHSDE